MIDWFENLPEQCPPSDATYPNGMTVYRFSFTGIPDNPDFISQRMQNPEKVFHGVDECTAKSLSVFDSLDACQNKLKLPRNRKRFSGILEVNLTNEDGLIKKTFSDPDHYSWWRSNTFTFENVRTIE